MGTEDKLEKGCHSCPYCDDEIAEASLPYRQACEVTEFHCPKCRKPVSRDKQVCPECGAEIKVEDA